MNVYYVCVVVIYSTIAKVKNNTYRPLMKTD